MKEMLMFLVAASLICVFNSPAHCQNSKDDKDYKVYPVESEKLSYRAWIAIESDSSHLTIKAFCFNSTSEDKVLRYKLETEKSGKSGKSTTYQSGSVSIPSQEKKCLSQVGLNVSPKDRYQIKLEVFKDGKLVAEDSVVYPLGTWM